MGNYFEQMKLAMLMLAEEPKTLFLGQAVEYDGTVMTTTLKEVPAEKKLEMPVNEELQMGISIGLSTQDIIPVSIYPRWNFLVLATNQLVNHLDKLSYMKANGGGVIVRVGVGSQIPLHPQHQHIANYSEQFRTMLDHVSVLECHNAEDIVPHYTTALERARNGMATIVSEFGDYFGTK